MKELITPCLWFDNQAKEAAALYCKVFPGARIVVQSPIVTEIEVAGQHITLLDGGPMYRPNPSISLYYICETEEEIDNIWEAFSRDGSLQMPLDKYPWSEKYGWISDRFGISWQLSLGKIETGGQKITPFLLFVGDQYGRVEEAIQHYTSIFKDSGTDSILRYSKDELPDIEGKVKLARIDLDGQKFMLMESAHAHKFAFNEGVSLTIHCNTQEEIDHYWGKLTERGAESMCGWLKDRFGVSWQVIPTVLGKLMTDPNKAGKAAKAFMQMRKFDIEKIVQATLD
ncbi:VOC family protein [Flavitalea sp. BT771]|uniref:VOC family protein n=1 Tax=Flavitalea sp. BT771 TaxID=3063329 RepID=UPI0026E3225F|nr:VOC family protein [Flavitalea sp. BT771]MDO6430270.1 VOC family protein [Flavitalea sp. BT771]MDV6219590.1 VOC family protein [Flavitalea sp. BT771]